MTRSTPSDVELLEHARAVFLEQGVRATAAEVASRAGVSEALLFKRFQSKDRLFRRAMSLHFHPDLAKWIEGLPARVGRGRLAEQLEEVGLEAISFFRQMMPLVMMSWSASPSDVAEDHGSPEAPPFETRRRLEAYFEAERRRGRLRANTDSELLARLFMGALFNFASWDITFGDVDPRPLGPEAYVRHLVRTLLEGVAPVEDRNA
jgi:AcrR family transcriptional regulator